MFSKGNDDGISNTMGAEFIRRIRLAVESGEFAHPSACGRVDVESGKIAHPSACGWVGSINLMHPGSSVAVCHFCLLQCESINFAIY